MEQYDTVADATIQLRLTRDECRLELFLPTNSLPLPTAVLLEQIRQRSERLHMHVPLTEADLQDRMRCWEYGRWGIILEGLPAIPPVDEQVELLVPVPVSNQKARTAYQTVLAGEPIARIRPGRPGTPGRDLRAGEIPVRPYRHARLPQGENTQISADGTLLVATCDGEVVLRQMAVHVLPTYVHDGDLVASYGPIKSQTRVTVRGNVQTGAVIEAAGDVHVMGDVEGGQISSLHGSIAVTGSVTGTTAQPGRIQAGGDVRCGAVLRAEIEAGKDLHLLATAHRCALQAGGNVYLEQTLMQSLHEVRLTVAGGVLPRLHSMPELVAMAPDAERQHVRAATSIPADVALHGAPPLVFQSCVVEDLSGGGVRCRFSRTIQDALPAVDAIVQLKFVLPGSNHQILGIGRVARQAGPSAIGVAFLQMREHDQALVREFARGLRQRAVVKAGSRADRRPEVDHARATG